MLGYTGSPDAVISTRFSVQPLIFPLILERRNRQTCVAKYKQTTVFPVFLLLIPPSPRQILLTRQPGFRKIVFPNYANLYFVNFAYIDFVNFALSKYVMTDFIPRQINEKVPNIFEYCDMEFFVVFWQ